MNRLALNILTICTLFLVLLVSCKQLGFGKSEEKVSKNTVIGYVLKEGVCFYKKPQIEMPCEKSRTLGSPSQLEVIQHNIDPLGNDSRKIKFYKARWNDEIGYISYQEELDKKSFYAIEKWESSKKAKVNVSSLRFRALPSLEARNIRPLLRGAELEVLGMGLIKFVADDKYDAWAHVRDVEGEEGFAFAGFLDIEEVGLYPTGSYSGSGDSGFVLLKQMPENLISDLSDTSANLPLKSLESISKISCDADCIPIPYEDKVEKDGRVFFLINRQFRDYGINYVEDGNLYRGWIDSAYVEAHGKDLFEYTRNRIKDNTILGLLDYIKSTVGSDLKNAYDLKILEKVSSLDDSGAYYVVEWYDHDTDYNAWNRGSGVYLFRNGEVRRILSGFDSLKYVDLNKDGSYEWVTTSSGRSDMSYILYGNIRGEMKELARLNHSEYEGCTYSLNGSDNYQQLKLAEDYVQQRCNLEWEKSGEITIDHGLGRLRFRYNGSNLVRL